MKIMQQAWFKDRSNNNFYSFLLYSFYSKQQDLINSIVGQQLVNNKNFIIKYKLLNKRELKIGVTLTFIL